MKLDWVLWKTCKIHICENELQGRECFVSWSSNAMWKLRTLNDVLNRDAQGSLFCFGAGQKKKNWAGVGQGGVNSSGQGGVTVKLGAAIFPRTGAGWGGACIPGADQAEWSCIQRQTITKCKYFFFPEVRSFGLKMPKEMINFTLDRKGNEPWGFVIVGGKDQVTICRCHCHCHCHVTICRCHCHVTICHCRRQGPGEISIPPPFKLKAI